MITDFETVKYIKNIFKVPIHCIFNTQQKITLKNSVSRLDYITPNLFCGCTLINVNDLHLGPIK